MGTINRRRFVVLGGLVTGLLGVSACGTPLKSPRLSGSGLETGIAQTIGKDLSLATNRQTIKGFANKVSAGDGEKVSLYVTTPAKAFDVFVLRLGWYDNGARSADLVDHIPKAPGVVQPSPQIDSITGLISAAHWKSNATVTVSGWPSGIYLLKLVADDGDQNYLPLVVRDDLASHDLLFMHSVNTDQAYNGWGGKSLYTFNSSGPVTVGGTIAGVKASFDRPFDRDGSGTAILSWELNMVRWLEANRFDVAYATDVEVHRDSQFASRFRAVVQAGHSEYWSKEMRDNLQEASSQGKGLGLFTGDTGSWAVRYEGSPLGSNRVLVCYRRADLDPITASEPARTTARWVDPPLNRPTQTFFGIGSNGLVAASADWIAKGVESAPELFAGTGFNQNDVVKYLVGYEYDGLWTPGAGKDLPVGLTVLGRSPLIPASPQEEQRQFAVRYDWEDADVIPLGRLTTTVDTLQPGPCWTLMVNVSSADGHTYLQYETEEGPPYQYVIGRTSYAIFPLAPDYSELGTRALDRDLVADYTKAYGRPSRDARVTAVVVRGSVGLGPLTITAPDGTVHSAARNVGQKEETDVWYVAEGNGTLNVQATGSSGPDMVIEATLPADRRSDEADTIAIKRPNSGLVIAAGTIQWSWALDDVGVHLDKKGNETKVDPRIQALTRNMLRQLIASGR